jgi:FkbM family methyltransferase
MGWRGINVEPLASVFDRIAQARERDVNLNVAVEDSAGQTTYYSVDGDGGLSTGDKELAETLRQRGHTVSEVRVRTTTLADICRAHVTGQVHFLKIDVEQLEERVLLGADFHRFRPWIILAESRHAGEVPPSPDDWEPIVLDAGYTFVYCDGLNRYYVSNERIDELGPAFTVPPNVFDDFVLYRVAQLERHQRTVGTLLDLPLAADPDEIVARLRALIDDRVQYEKLSHGLRIEADTLWQASFEDGRHIAWLAAEVDNLQSRSRRQANVARAETVQLRAELDNVRGERDEIRREREFVESEIERFREELLEARVEAHVRACELEELRRSTSWVLTRPLRGFSRRLRPARAAR